MQAPAGGDVEGDLEISASQIPPAEHVGAGSETANQYIEGESSISEAEEDAYETMYQARRHSP